jgi:hypothetical protein
MSGKGGAIVRRRVGLVVRRRCSASATSMRGNDKKGTSHWRQSREGTRRSPLRSGQRKGGPEAPGPSGQVLKALGHQARTKASRGGTGKQAMTFMMEG